MTHNRRLALLIASLVIVAWSSTAEACHRRRSCAPDPCGKTGYGYASPTGYYASQQGYAAGTAGYSTDGWYGNGMSGYPGSYGYLGSYGGYGYGQPGYNPGGLGGPMSGLGVRPGLGFGGLGRGR